MMEHRGLPCFNKIFISLTVIPILTGHMIVVFNIMSFVGKPLVKILLGPLESYF